MAELFHVQVQQLLTINLTKYVVTKRKQTFEVEKRGGFSHLRSLFFPGSNSEVESIKRTPIKLAGSSDTRLIFNG